MSNFSRFFLAALLAGTPTLLNAQISVPSASSMPSNTNMQQNVPGQTEPPLQQNAPGGAGSQSSQSPVQVHYPQLTSFDNPAASLDISAKLSFAKDILAQLMDAGQLKGLLDAEDAQFGAVDSADKLNHRQAALTSAIRLLKGHCQ